MQANSSLMNHGKKNIGRLAEIMARKGVVHVVASPGSRNAPFIIVFSNNGKLKLTSIADERSAGFVALGMAMQLKQTVALVCTSGSAAVNYAPAISEAYYQKIPLLVITADRPSAWIDQGDGQTIRQDRLFSNFIRKSYSLPESSIDPESEWYFGRIVNEAIDRCNFPVSGPVHLNLHVSEPLYELDGVDTNPEVRIIGISEAKPQISDETLAELAKTWNFSAKKMILTGQFHPSDAPGQVLSQLANDPSVVVLTETTSNLSGNHYLGCIDRVIEGIVDDDPDFTPELLLTIGGAVVSKKIKSLLRKMRPRHHWHVSPDPDEFHFDTYQSLTLTIPVEPGQFLQQLSKKAQKVHSSYRNNWVTRNQHRRQKHGEYLEMAGYTDLKVFEQLFDWIPNGSHIHLGNSTPVRYAQLFEYRHNFHFWSNRGTSGIDGCVSTAVGAAMAINEMVTVITGDIGFFYDSNALWNQYLPSNFRIILINNGGGNIFRILPGPDRYKELETYIETAHSYSAQGITENFGVAYFRVENLEELHSLLPLFYSDLTKPALLEIVTPAIESAETLREYFKNLMI